MHSKKQILERLAIYRVEGGGIGSWLTNSTRDAVFDRLGRLQEDPLPAVQLNQLLVLAHEAPVSDGFYHYYWLRAPETHPYEVRRLPDFRLDWLQADAIRSLDHLSWGLYRLYVDGLLYFGNVRTAFRHLRGMSGEELAGYFQAKRFDTVAIERRGPALPLRQIEKDKRYLISEMACKSYGENAQVKSDLREALIEAHAASIAAGASNPTIRELLEGHLPDRFSEQRSSLKFSASEILDSCVQTVADVDQRYLEVARRFDNARQDALHNTELYLSMLTDLDVYVATSMREPSDFVKMADTCATVFSDPRLKNMNLRYFDPTLSAANGHEDKGLLECLMVKCAKALVYCRGDKESYGKDAEAAMALSLGRPVIFYCEQKADFYRDVHPLARLIDFQTGVAVGAMVTDKLNVVSELLRRTFENRMVYRLERSRNDSLRLTEELTGSVVRLQTSDKLIAETFWNHYHQERNDRPRQQSADVKDISTARPLPETRPRPVPMQEELGLERTTELTQLAARRSLERPTQMPSGSSPPRTGHPEPTVTFPLTSEEIFDGISRLKRNQGTGAKRYGTFSLWIQSERIAVAEQVRLLRFIEQTLEANKPRSNYVYAAADLTRWYIEMSNGEAVGSWR